MYVNGIESESLSGPINEVYRVSGERARRGSASSCRLRVPRRRAPYTSDMTETTHVNTEVTSGVLVANLKTQSLSEYEAGVIGKQITADAPKSGWKVLLNLEEVQFMASAGLGMIVSLANQAKKAGGKLVISNVNDEIRAVLKMTKLDKLFPIEKSNEKALKKLA